MRLRDTVVVTSDTNNIKSFDAVVAMAVYKQDRLAWVKCSLNSLLNQTYQNFLIITVIDGPIGQDLAEYLSTVSKSHNNFLLMERKINVGLSTCMNDVVDWVTPLKPQYFFRMDADDISEPNRIIKQIEFFKRNPEISILGSGLVEINEEGKRVGQRKLPLKHNEIIGFLPKRCSINHPTVSLRFNIFNQGYRYREDLLNTQDYFFWTDLATAGFKFANLPDKLLRFRRVNDFYKRRGLEKSLNEYSARFYAMKKLKKYSIGNILYANAVLLLRLMPPSIIKLAYKIDRYLLSRKVKHD